MIEGIRATDGTRGVGFTPSPPGGWIRKGKRSFTVSLRSLLDEGGREGLPAQAGEGSGEYIHEKQYRKKRQFQ